MVPELTDKELHLVEEQLFFEIFEKNSAVKLLLDVPTGKIEDANTAAEAFYGYPRDALRTMNIADINVMSRDAIQEEIEKFAAGKQHRVNDSHRIASGAIREVEVYSGLIHYKSRSFLLSIVFDLSQWKQTERSLREIDEIFNLFMEYSPVHVFFKDQEGRALKLSRNFENMLGRPVTEMIGKTMFELFPPDLARSMTEDDLRILRENKAVDIEESLADRHYRTVKFPILENGQAKYVAGFTIDITEQSRSRLELQKIKEHLHLTLESTHSSSFDTNLRTRELHTTPALYEFLGYGPQEIPKTSEDILPLIHPEDLVTLREHTARQRPEQAEQYYVEFRLKSKAGEWIWVNAVGKIFEFAEDGRPERIIGISTVIHDRKMAEEEKRKLEEQMRQTQKLESLGVLAGGIAHDFNNLLTGIFGNIEMASVHCPPGTTAREFLDQARSAFHRAHNLTLQLLTFSKGGAPAKKTGNIARLLRETTLFALSGSKVACRFDIAEDLCLCDFDEHQLSQVIDNVVINARQAMPNGGIITITAKNTDHPPMKKPGDGPYIHISVSDTGEGIPAPVLPRIFEPFFSTKKQGSGLGLATTYSIIQRHEGHITVDSTPGVGSVFHIFLPAAKVQIETPNAILSEVEHKGQGTILIMDDEETLRYLLGSMLKLMGYIPVCTSDGLQAIEALKELRKKGENVVGAILDLTIQGGMGGKETRVELHRIDPDLCILATSGYSEDPVMANPHMFGFAGRIEKPYLMQDLAAALSRVISSRAPSA